MNTVVLSFLAMISVPCAVVFVLAGVGRIFFRKPWPKRSELALNLVLSCGITVAITLAICFVLKWTGFFDSFFYRPSTRDYGEQQNLSSQPEDVFFESLDGTRLHGQFIPAEGDAAGTVIHYHGSDRNISFTIRNSAWLSSRGYNVFVFDYRGYGKSSGPRPGRRQ